MFVDWNNDLLKWIYLLQYMWRISCNVWASLYQWIRPGIGVTKLISFVPLIPHFSIFRKCSLPIEYHVHIYHVSPQFNCRDTWQLWPWLKGCKLYYTKLNICIMKKLMNGVLGIPTPTPLALWQSNACLIAGEIDLKNVCKYIKWLYK